MYLKAIAIASLAATNVAAYPWMAAKESSSLLEHPLEKRESSCPSNSNHKDSPPISSKYPYTGAKNGLPGTGKGGVEVPAPGDTAHQFKPPGSSDIRGPCPGLNAMANHNFIARDGITNFFEMVNAQQNMFNVGWDLAVVLATIGIATTGDPVTLKMSIGCDATSRTQALGGLLSGILPREPGLDGHNKFEVDTSLTRNDYFLDPARNNHAFNGTLFGYMADTCGNNFNLQCLADYRYTRYQQSKADNGQFFFGPGVLPFYGAASFLYELYPGSNYPANLDTVSSFFGASRSGNSWYFNGGERIPATGGWKNRESAYGLTAVGGQLLEMYLKHPVLFGFNAGRDNFNLLNSGSAITGGKLDADATSVLCVIYQAFKSGSANAGSIVGLPSHITDLLEDKVGGVLGEFGC